MTRKMRALLLSLALLLAAAPSGCGAEPEGERRSTTTTTTTKEAAQDEGAGSHQRRCTTDALKNAHPVLCRMLDRLEDDPAGLVGEIHDWAKDMGLLVQGPVNGRQASRYPVVPRSADQLPVVFAHGMGDSCFNDGMQRIAEHASDLLGGVYSTCVAIGKDRQEDTSNGYFLNMDASVDSFAQSVRTDPNLQSGFHAIGFSQGCNVIRGYIGRYNDPPVHTFLSVNGVNAGEGAVPYCRPKAVSDINPDRATLGAGGICDLLMEQASRHAYSEWTQKHSFQANYWRDPRPVEKQAYETFSQLARWNNEGGVFNRTLKENWAKTSKFVWVLAKQDSLVWPIEGEHWGAPDPSDPFRRILPMNQTEWYVKDLFGLRTAQEAGKNFFEEFDADHLQFSMDDFDRWVITYLRNRDDHDDARIDSDARAVVAATE